MEKRLGRKFWISMLIFGLIGQVAWVVENMYFNVFIYKMFHASAAEISLMVGASSVAATVTTILIGALSDKMGKRKLFICAGYAIWGVTILSFSLIRVEVLTAFTGSVTAAMALGVNLVILMDCVMTFFGSAANDAAYNAWLTDRGDESNRGKIEGFNSMMPLLSILVVFGGFMGLDLNQAESWTWIFLIIGGVVLLMGLLGFVLIEDAPVQSRNRAEDSYWETVLYSFRPRVLLENKLLYAVLGAFALFGISIQVFMPYLILYYEQSLQMANYVLVMAPAIIVAAVITSQYGKLYDMLGFKGSVLPSVSLLMAGYVILFFTRSTLPVFVGSLLMMTGYMTGMAVFGAMIRDRIPENRAGQFQGIRIIGQVLVPGMIGPAVGAFVLRNADVVVNSDGTTSFLPHRGIWLAAFLAGLVLVAALLLIFRMMRLGHHELWSECGERLKDREVCWKEHPRPQMKRENWVSLNGRWKLNGQDIRVPFPPQSLLSDYEEKVGNTLLYEKTFSVPDTFTKARILLHFGAADQVAKVWLNDTLLGSHEGGYLPFVWDITEQVQRNGENRLKVQVTDTLSPEYPYGKQCKKRGGMWYTPVSGIWQSVWLENVPETYIKNIRITPDLEGVDLCVEQAQTGFEARVQLDNGESLSFRFEENTGRITLAGAKRKDGSTYKPVLWTPEHPYLYPMTLTAGEDQVETYFALRTVSIEERKGISRVCLNGDPIFLHGVLDQGYFSDGLFLPAEEEEYERDILRMKELGINLLRKHIKVEPEYFYYACDKLGMLVMQDMVNSGSYHFIRETALPTVGLKKRSDRSGMTGKRKEFFLAHSEAILQHLYNHPSVVAYTIFNEGWGQFESDAIYRRLKAQDGTRLYDSTSGWFAQEENDFDSEHIYFKAIPLTPGKRPLFVSECGGYSMPVQEHCYSKYNQYGYGACKDSKELTDRIEEMYRVMILSSIPAGLCGCVYTQNNDVEDEINGLYTYDRRVCKVEKERMQALAEEMKQAMQNC